MPIHPHPDTMATHVEHHRQELIKQAHQERIAKEAIGGGGAQDAWIAAGAAAIGHVRAVFARLRPALTEPLDVPRSRPGEAQ